MIRLKHFESIARVACRLTELPTPAAKGLIAAAEQLHPFETRNIHPDLPAKVRSLFDDGHYAEATFEACKFLESFVARHTSPSKKGVPGMMEAFSRCNPRIRLNPNSTESEKDEQEGYKFLFAGTIMAIRNPRAHSHSMDDDPGTCLDHLGMVSALLRRLNQAGFK